MAILEVGIQFRGFVLVSEVFYAVDGAVDVDLRGSLMSAIVSFAEQTFSGDLQAFTFKKYALVFGARRVVAKGCRGEEPMVCYAVLDKELKARARQKVRERLERLLDAFLKSYAPAENTYHRISEFRGFRPTFAAVLKSTAMKLDDRARQVLGVG
ncbi:MAG: hypothetical protein Kow0069_23680 [Promethearchaeota archaeon]